MKEILPENQPQAEPHTDLGLEFTLLVWGPGWARCGCPQAPDAVNTIPLPKNLLDPGTRPRPPQLKCVSTHPPPRPPNPTEKVPASRSLVSPKTHEESKHHGQMGTEIRHD